MQLKCRSVIPVQKDDCQKLQFPTSGPARTPPALLLDTPLLRAPPANCGAPSDRPPAAAGCGPQLEQARDRLSGADWSAAEPAATVEVTRQELEMLHKDRCVAGRAGEGVYIGWERELQRRYVFCRLSRLSLIQRSNGILRIHLVRYLPFDRFRHQRLS